MLAASAHGGLLMLEADDVVVDLLDPDVSIQEKVDILADFFERWEAFGKNMSLGVRGGRQLGLDALYRNRSAEELARLKAVLAEVGDYAQHRRARRQEEARQTIERLRQLTPATALVIRNLNREDVVRFVEAKRTRFVVEYPDGQLVSVPAELFCSCSHR